MIHWSRRTVLAGSASLLLSGAARAQTYPDKPVRIIVPFPAGGSVDLTARLLAQKMAESTGAQFVVESRSGAGGNVGADMVAKAEPDGYTLLHTAPGPLAINQKLYTSIPFDPERDFAPIALFATTPLVLMVANNVPAKNVQELIAYAKANPGKVTYASAGAGSTPHLTGELFGSMTKTSLTHVPYKGTGPAMNDLVGGHVSMFFDLLPSALPQISAGRVRALGSATATRPPALPDLPTVAEQGLAGFDASSWLATVAPAKTPAPVLAKLRAEAAKAIAAPDVVKRLAELGSEAGTADEAKVRAFLKAEADKWGKVIEVSGAKAE